MDYKLNAEVAKTAVATAQPEYVVENQQRDQEELDAQIFVPRGRVGNTQGANPIAQARRRAAAIAGRKANVQRLIAAKRKG